MVVGPATLLALGLAILVSVAVLVSCGGGGGSTTSAEKIWCLEPGEKLTAEFKQRYSERFMTRADCHFWLTGELPTP